MHGGPCSARVLSGGEANGDHYAPLMRLGEARCYCVSRARRGPAQTAHRRPRLRDSSPAVLCRRRGAAPSARGPSSPLDPLRPARTCHPEPERLCAAACSVRQWRERCGISTGRTASCPGFLVRGCPRWCEVSTGRTTSSPDSPVPEHRLRRARALRRGERSSYDRSGNVSATSSPPPSPHHPKRHLPNHVAEPETTEVRAGRQVRHPDPLLVLARRLDCVHDRPDSLSPRVVQVDLHPTLQRKLVADHPRLPNRVRYRAHYRPARGRCHLDQPKIKPAQRIHLQPRCAAFDARASRVARIDTDSKVRLQRRAQIGTGAQMPLFAAAERILVALSISFGLLLTPPRFCILAAHQ